MPGWRGLWMSRSPESVPRCCCRRLPGVDVAVCASEEPGPVFCFFFSPPPLFFQGVGVVWFANIYENHKPPGTRLLSGSLVSCTSPSFNKVPPDHQMC